jgi:hypothetical protein
LDARNFLSRKSVVGQGKESAKIRNGLRAVAVKPGKCFFFVNARSGLVRNGSLGSLASQAVTGHLGKYWK